VPSDPPRYGSEFVGRVETLAALNPDIQVKLAFAEDPRLQGCALRQCLCRTDRGNLVSSAFKFTTAPGTIEVSTSVQEGHFKLLVCDSGTGISEAELPHVFEPDRRSAFARRPDHLDGPRGLE
jgi:signal transduction histidine kinase